VAPNADEQTSNLAEILTQRERISIAEYERIMTLTEPLPRRGSEFQFTGVVEQRRQYAS
jgi:hypothetical protein